MAAANNNLDVFGITIKLEEFFDLQLKIFKILGLNIIPIERTSTKAKVIDQLMRYYFCLCIVGFILDIIQFGVKIIMHIKDVHMVVKILPNMILFPYNCSKAILFYVKRKKIFNLLEKITILYPVTEADQEKYKLGHNLKESYMCNKIYILNYIGILSMAGCEIMYQYFFNHVRKTSAELWYPFDPLANNKNFISAILWAVWSMYNAIFITIAVDLFLWAIFLILSIEFKIIGENMKEAINKKEVSKLNELISQHQDLINMHDEIESSFDFIFFCTFIQGAASISSSSFQILTAFTTGDLVYALMYAVCSIIQVFLYCYFGEKLIVESCGVGEKVLTSNWSDIDDNKVKKLILMIVFRSQKACKLSGYGFVTLSVETFSNVLQSAYSFFTIIRNVYFK